MELKKEKGRKCFAKNLKVKLREHTKRKERKKTKVKRSQNKQRIIKRNKKKRMTDMTKERAMKQ